MMIFRLHYYKTNSEMLNGKVTYLRFKSMNKKPCCTNLWRKFAIWIKPWRGSKETLITLKMKINY